MKRGNFRARWCSIYLLIHLFSTLSYWCSPFASSIFNCSVLFFTLFIPLDKHKKLKITQNLKSLWNKHLQVNPPVGVCVHIYIYIYLPAVYPQASLPVLASVLLFSFFSGLSLMFSCSMLSFVFLSCPCLFSRFPIFYLLSLSLYFLFSSVTIYSFAHLSLSIYIYISPSPTPLTTYVPLSLSLFHSCSFLPILLCHFLCSSFLFWLSLPLCIYTCIYMFVFCLLSTCCSSPHPLSCLSIFKCSPCQRVPHLSLWFFLSSPNQVKIC